MNREDFLIFKNSNMVYFDNGATTLKPIQVRDAINKYYDEYTANIHRGDYTNSLKVSELYDNCRELVRELINAKHTSEIVFTAGTTASLNDIAFGYFANHLKKGDEVLITESEHASNVLPWFILQKELGIIVNYIPLNDNHEVTIDALKSVISNKTKAVSLAHITNVIGDVRDIKTISKVCHDNNILLVVDAAQSIAHEKIDVVDMDIDFMAFSGHKMYGPTGIGVLYGKFDLLKELKPRSYGGGMNAIFNKDGYVELKDLPDKLEAGTPNIEGVLGLSACINYINSIGINKINKYEHELRDYLVSKLSELDFIKIYNKDNYSTIVAFNINGVFSQDTAIYLDKYNICVRAGNHCAKILKNVFNIANTCRISLSFYNTREEIDLLINVLRNSKNIWEEIL
ncbi:MAG: aminotransferase class V-fold PLP-dependent enzyme [Erysipelotrichaceae bacterium]|nr:aminotransferase class V-fold PLP-dependent enzyme [Erysipelotrichaceae bacterium]